MKIDGMRLARDIETIASFNETSPTVGFSRPTFSPAWRAARDYVIDQARAAGCAIRIDAAGNVHARPQSVGWDARVWLSGSHIDSVPTGGKFDGVVGVVGPLEILRAVHESGRRDLPLELIIFAEEEGTTFNLGMLGSRAWAGTLSVEQLAALKNKNGESFLQAGAPCGVNAEQLVVQRLNPAAYRGFIELHIEQGPALWNQNVPAALVTAINGRRQFTCTITGQANHAGSTKMADRDDALVMAAEIIAALETLARELNEELDHTVITVGRLHVEPNALNVIPGRVEFFIDFRARSNDMLQQGEPRIDALIEAIWQRRGSKWTLTRTESLPAVPMDAGICRQLRDAAGRLGVPVFPDVASGALHDAAILAPLLPTAMLFVASQGGISHNPAEFSRLEDILLATHILAEAVTA